jgi:hypothetical protein
LRWTEWSINRRGAGPIDGQLLGRGAGEGFGVHISTGPVYIRGAEPGDILEVRIMDVKPRPSANPAYAGKQQRGGLLGLPLQRRLTEPKPREVCTIYEIDTSGQRNWAQAVYNFRCAQDHRLSGCAGRPLNVQDTRGILKNVRIPI